MNAKTLFKSCLLACSVLAGAQAVANPMSSTSQSTVNSIEFSFMSYSSTPSPYFSSATETSFNQLPSTPAAAPASSTQMIIPTEIYVPSTSDQTTMPQIIVTSGQTQQAAPAAAAVIPEPGSVALLGLGLALLILRRREGLHD